MDYNDVLKKLNRYDWDQKQFQVSNLSFQSFTFFKRTTRERVHCPSYLFPWNVDSFAAFCLLSKDCSFYHKAMGSKESDREMNQIMASIHGAIPALTGLPKEALGLSPFINQQVSYQQDYHFLLYRYSRFFDVQGPVGDAFRKKTHCSSYTTLSTIIRLVEALAFTIDANPIESAKILKNVLLHSPQDFSFFTRTREQINKMQINLINPKGLANVRYSLSDLVFSFKPLTLYPFLQEEDGIRLLVPHSLPFAFTNGLFFSLTENDPALKTEFGLLSLQKYLFGIISESGAYDDVCGDEVQYGPKQQRISPPDVTVYEKGKFIFFESKTLTPRKRTRINDPADLTADFEKVVKAVKQVLRQYQNYRSGLYKPFEGKNYQVDDVYLVVSTIFLETFQIEEVEKAVVSDPEFIGLGDYLSTHLLVSDVYCLESYYLEKKSILPDLIDFGQRKQLINLRPNQHQSEEPIKSFSDFEEKGIEDCNALLDSVKDLK